MLTPCPAVFVDLDGQRYPCWHRLSADGTHGSLAHQHPDIGQWLGADEARQPDPEPEQTVTPVSWKREVA